MKKISFLFALLALLLGVTSSLNAQTATGQITGTVKDASSAVLARAKVTITNQANGFTREAATNEEGSYSFPLLPVGNYTVTVAQAGFSTSKQSNVQLTVDKIA